MNLLQWLFGKRRPVPVERRARTSSDWAALDTDAGLGDAGAPAIRKPINIMRTMLMHPYSVLAGDYMHVVLDGEDESGRAHHERTPDFLMERTMTIDSITRFEVIDEFGVDVGIGFVLGEAKK